MKYFLQGNNNNSIAEFENSEAKVRKTKAKNCKFDDVIIDTKTVFLLGGVV